MIFRILTKNCKKNRKLSPEAVETIIHAFGTTLEEYPPKPGYVSDEDRLPYPKEVIKRALMQAMQAETDEDIRTLLKLACLKLARWQKGVGTVDQPCEKNIKDNLPLMLQFFKLHGKTGKNWADVVSAEEAAADATLEEALENALDNASFF